MNTGNRRAVADLLAELNALDEHARIDAKTSRDMGTSVLETVCAFANTPSLGGGYLLLGVAPAKDSPLPGYEAVGVGDADKTQADLATQCSSVFNALVRPEMWVETVHGKAVVGVFVPESPAGDKPVYFQRRGLPQGAYIRVGSTDQRCTDDDLLTLYQDRRLQTYDTTPVPDADLTDLDPEAIEDYRKARGETNPGAEELNWSDDDLLRALGCVAQSPAGQVPTVAGMLLFGKAMSLRRVFPMVRLDYIRIAGKEWVQDPERRFDTVEMRGPLIRLIRRAWAAVMDDVPRSFFLPEESPKRTEEPVVPARAVREAIVNALMHRDYRVHSPAQIIRYSNRLEVRNAGYSLVDEERFGEPGSVSRNTQIASVLHDANLAETKGSGIRVMRDLMQAANLSLPTFTSDRQGNRFIATFLFHHFLGPEDVAWLERFKDAALTDGEARALVFVRETGAITNAAYRDINRVDTLSASMHLRRLRDAGLLEQQGKGAATYYVPGARLSDRPAGNGAPEPSGTSEPRGLTPQPRGLTPQPGGLEELPPALRSVVDGLGHRKRPEEVRQAILELCRWRACRLDEMAGWLERNPEYLRQTYIAPMLREGLLVYAIPTVKYHPEQAYRAAAQEVPDNPE